MPEGVKHDIIFLAGWMLIVLSGFVTNDTWLTLLALMVFVACGVPWELQHWRPKQVFSNGEEIPEE